MKAFRAAGLAMAMATALAGTARAQAVDNWTLRLPKEDAVPYRGLASFDGAGGAAAGMLYPVGGAGLAGLLVGIAVHAALAESTKNTEKRNLQAAADKVLEPYREILAGLQHREMMTLALARSTSPGSKRLVAAGEAAGGSWEVLSIPVYAMTQDHRALVLDNAVAIYRPGQSDKPAYEKIVRVVSQPQAGTEPGAHWTKDAGAGLKEESASLLAHSLDLALRDAIAPTPVEAPVFKTLRYAQGEDEKMERGQLLAQACQRQVLRTLRGGLMSVPLAGEPAADCTPALAGWK